MGKTERHQIAIGDKYWWVKIDSDSGHYFASPQQEKEMVEQKIVTGCKVIDLNYCTAISLVEFLSPQYYGYYKKKFKQKGRDDAD